MDDTFIGWVHEKCRCVATSIWFESFFVLLILANSIILLVYVPNAQNSVIVDSEPMFLSFFTFELCFKFIAASSSIPVFMRNSKWNLFDLLLVGLGWIQFGTANFGMNSPVVSIFRLVRVLRPLQQANPSLMWVTHSIFRALPMICSAAVVFVAVQIVFAVCGLVYFSGSLLHRCSNDLDQLCGDGAGVQCEPQGMCILTDTNPDSNVTSFDDIFHVIPILFQSITMEGWSDVMYYVADTNGGATQLYFILQVVFGGYFMLRIVVAVLAVNISLERHETENKRKLAEVDPNQIAYDQFCNQHGISLISQMQMRLVLSYEMSGDRCVTKGKQQEYYNANQSVYHEWRALILPILTKPAPLPTIAIKDTKQQQQHRCCSRIQTLSLAGESPRANPITRLCYTVAKSSWFQMYFMNGIIVLNFLALAAIHYNQPTWMFDLQYACDYLFFAIFTLEMLVKIVGFGFVQYWTRPAFAFEGTLTMLGFLQFAPGIQSNIASPLRALRLLRIFPLLAKLKSMQVMVQAFILAIRVALPFVFVMVIFLIIFATLGLHLYGGRLQTNLKDCSPSYELYPKCPPRFNFDTAQNAFLTTFVLLVAENWNLIMLDVVASTSLWSFVYFAFALVLGNWILLSVFLGVLIDSFLQVRERERASHAVVADKDGEDQEQHQSPSKTFSDTYLNLGGRLKFITRKSHRSMRELARRIDLDAEEHKATLALQEHVEEQQKLKRKLEHIGDFTTHKSFQYPSFLCMHRNTKLRMLLGSVAVSQWFRYVMIAIILASSVSVAFVEAPVEVTYVFFVLFLFEFLLKCAAFGVAGHPGAYFSSKLNVMDFVLLILNLITVVHFAVHGMQGAAGKTLQATRAFSILRIVRYLRGIQVTLNSLASSFSPLAKLCLVVACFFLGWGVLATFIFNGMLYACVDESTGARIPQDDLCMMNEAYGAYCNNTCPGLWENPRYGTPGTFYSFDHLGDSLLILFEMTTDEDWFVPMLAAMDSPMQIGKNAVREISYASSVFFCLVIIFFNMFLMQVFVAVMVDEFRQSGRVADSRAFLTTRQVEWVKFKRLSINLPFTRDPGPPRRSQTMRTYSLVTNKWFVRAYIVLIAFNTCVLLSIHYNPSEAYKKFFQVTDWMVGSLYWVVLVLHMVAFSWQEFLFGARCWANWLNIVVCVTTAVGWASPEFFPTAQFIDSLQVVHLPFAVPQTRRLLDTLSLSAPQVFNVTTLLFLVLYIYSVVGIAVFSSIEMDNNNLKHLNHYANFDTFENAMVTLFRMSSGEGWNSLMREMAVVGNGFAYPYCLTFIMTVQFLLMNLIVAVVIFDLEDEVEQNDEGSNLKLSHLVDYVDCWTACRLKVEEDNLLALMETALPTATKPNLNEILGNLDVDDDIYDADHQLWLPVDMVLELLDMLPEPLRVSSTHSYRRQVLRQLKIPVNARGEIHFHATLNALVDGIVLGDAVNFRDTAVRAPSDSHMIQLRNLVNLELSQDTLQYELDWRSVMTTDDGMDAAQLLGLRNVQRAMKQHLVKRRLRLVKTSSNSSAASSGGEDDVEVALI